MHLVHPVQFDFDLLHGWIVLVPDIVRLAGQAIAGVLHNGDAALRKFFHQSLDGFQQASVAVDATHAEGLRRKTILVASSEYFGRTVIATFGDDDSAVVALNQRFDALVRLAHFVRVELDDDDWASFLASASDFLFDEPLGDCVLTGLEAGLHVHDDKHGSKAGDNGGDERQ